MTRPLALLFARPSLSRIHLFLTRPVAAEMVSPGLEDGVGFEWDLTLRAFSLPFSSCPFSLLPLLALAFCSVRDTAWIEESKRVCAPKLRRDVVCWDL